MNETQIIPELAKRVYTGQLYKTRALLIATIFGGPIASAIIIGHNFKVLGEKQKNRWTWFFSICFIFLMAFIDFLMEIPNFFLGLGWLVIAVTIMNKYQEKEIEAYIEQGETPHSNWKGFAVGLIVFLVFTLLMMAFSLL